MASYVSVKLFIKLNSLTVRILVNFIANPQSLTEDELTRQKMKLKTEIIRVLSNTGMRSGGVHLKKCTAVSYGSTLTGKDCTNGDHIATSANGMKMANASDTVISPLKLIQGQVKTLKLH
jgi:uncharacterized protein YdcH (DUF465 family)